MPRICLIRCSGIIWDNEHAYYFEYIRMHDIKMLMEILSSVVQCKL